MNAQLSQRDEEIKYKNIYVSIYKVK